MQKRKRVPICFHSVLCEGNTPKQQSAVRPGVEEKKPYVLTSGSSPECNLAGSVHLRYVRVTVKFRKFLSHCAIREVMRHECRTPLPLVAAGILPAVEPR